MNLSRFFKPFWIYNGHGTASSNSSHTENNSVGKFQDLLDEAVERSKRVEELVKTLKAKYQATIRPARSDE